MKGTKLLSINSVMEGSGVAFGTSGARGTVVAMTDLVCFAYTSGFLQHMSNIGEFSPGMSVAVAGDLRPSTPRIIVACTAAIKAKGGVPVFCGYTPSPALALFAYSQKIPSLMVTGSHIPDDRNGIKFNRNSGEILKADELGIRAQEIHLNTDLFDELGFLKMPPSLPVVVDVSDNYIQRYVDFFGNLALKGMRLGVYQHSAVGRDILVTLLNNMGAEVVALGRSENFIPVDTEAVRPEDEVLARQWSLTERLDAIISTDGDSDRPLIADETGEWLRGDVLGILCARYLNLKNVATPVSSNTALEKSGWFSNTYRTRIGSPYVIEAMQNALLLGLDGVCGYEANGGFLLGSKLEASGKLMGELPTRDAVLPMVSLLASASLKKCKISDLSGVLPKCVTFSDRIENFPTALSQARLAVFQVGDEIQQPSAFEEMFGQISGKVTQLNWTDGLRATFANNEIIHLRPSGNAPEFRCYTEAASMERAIKINRQVMQVLACWKSQ